MEHSICESPLLASPNISSKPHIGIVLIAAGASRRMGTNKQLIPWRGKTILDAVCSALVRGWESANTFPCIGDYPFVAVTHNDAPEVDAIVSSYGFSVVHNEHADMGQGSSIALGVKTLLDMQNLVQLDGIICSVADQPLLEPFVVRELIDTFLESGEGAVNTPVVDADSRMILDINETRTISVGTSSKLIVVPHYGALYQSGNPVLFGSHWFDALEHIEGDRGGKTIIRGEGEPFVKNLWISSDIGDDVDTPEDLERLRQREREVL